MSIIIPQFPPMDRSAQQCPSCHEHYALEVDEFNYMPGSLTCDTCGFVNKDTTKNLSFIAASAASMLDITNVLNQEWYHTTSTMNSWHEKVIDANVWVHIGHQATSECITDQYDQWSIPSETHVLRLKPALRIHAEIFGDTNNWPNFVGDLGMDNVEEFRQAHRWDAFRYINSFETPGQISLFIKPDAFEIVDTYSNY